GELVVGSRTVQLHLQLPQVLLQRLSEEILLRIDRGEVVVGVRRGRIDVDRLLELFDRLVEPPPVGELDPPGVVLVGPDGLVLSFGVASHGPQITRKGGPGLRLYRPQKQSLRRLRRPRLVSGRRVVLPESLQVFARLYGGFAGRIRRLVARQAVGGAAEQLADVAAENRHDVDGCDADQLEPDQVLAEPLTGLGTEKTADELAHGNPLTVQQRTSERSPCTSVRD